MNGTPIMFETGDLKTLLGEETVLHISKLSSLSEDRLESFRQAIAESEIGPIGALVISGVTGRGDEQSYRDALQLLHCVQQTFEIPEQAIAILPSVKDIETIDLFNQCLYFPSRKHPYHGLDAQVITLPNLQIITCNVHHENGVVGLTTEQGEHWIKQRPELAIDDLDLQRMLVTNAPMGDWMIWHQDTIYAWRKKYHLMELTVRGREEVRRVVPQVFTEPGCIQVLKVRNLQCFHTKFTLSREAWTVARGATSLEYVKTGIV